MYVCMSQVAKHVCMYVCLEPREVPPLTNLKKLNYRSNTERFFVRNRTHPLDHNLGSQTYMHTYICMSQVAKHVCMSQVAKHVCMYVCLEPPEVPPLTNLKKN